MLYVLAWFELVDASDHFIDGTEAEGSHMLAQVLRQDRGKRLGLRAVSQRRLQPADQQIPAGDCEEAAKHRKRHESDDPAKPRRTE